MVSKYSLLIFLCILVWLFNFSTTKAGPNLISQFCDGDNTTATSSTYQVNVRRLLSSLSSNATIHTFYNDTSVSRNSSDTVYGLFMCRGDVTSDECKECVVNATQKLSSDPQCLLSPEGVIWYDECMVRYSNRSFFTTVDTSPAYALFNIANISSNSTSFQISLSNTLWQIAAKAANSVNRYSTNNTTLSQSQTLYCLAQCTQDLSTEQCSDCLTIAIAYLPRCCDLKIGARVLFPSCNIRYELYPFYRDVTNKAQEGLVPETQYAYRDSEYSEDPGYIFHNCSRTTTEITTFQSNLRNLLSNLSSNATRSNEFQMTEGTIYGLFRCRGDISTRLCGQCIQNATERIASGSGCRLASTEAIIWYNHCWLRYSQRNFFSSMETSPRYRDLNISNTNPVQSSVVSELSNKIAEMAQQTGYSNDRFRRESLRLNGGVQTLYILAQCSMDLSTNSCTGCLNDMIGMAIPWLSLGSLGGRVYYPSCILRFEFFQFYDLPLPSIAPPLPPSPSGNNIVLILVLTITVSAGILFTLCFSLIRRKVRKNNKTILRENFGHESSTIESLQFNLPIIEAATNNFSHENKIGRGGFGEVYKGILIDGRPIAVKRLSTYSKQGVEEFKNEVLLIAKLQHRNLVTFIGFCLDEQEKVLIYEYVPNKSLDYFLFDTKLEKILSWSERYRIIGGIVRGILYLHEHSRLKVIHRDLKPSNVLLDENMNPKISDFGLARIVEIDQHEGSTNRIVGTYGYMSQEYALFGQFSEKSDVYSFGVMVLEIVSGKKNTSSYGSHRIGDNLINFVWKQWTDETPLNTLDPRLKEDYSNIEVIKCIQIGLLCVQENPDTRPTMMTIVSYLSNNSIELPSPPEPTSFLFHRMDPTTVHESSSRQSASNSVPSSINKMSLSEFYPR